MLYAPPAVLVAEATTTPAWSAWVEAPLIGVPPEALVTEPLIAPAPTPKERLLLACPPTVTITDPVVAPEGTGTVTLVLFQALGVAGVPLNVTVLNTGRAPKLVPVIVIGVPTDPHLGERPVNMGWVPRLRLIVVTVFAATEFAGFTVVTYPGTVTWRSYEPGERPEIE